MENRSNPAAMWDERFSKAEPVYGEQPNSYLRAQAQGLAPGASVLVPGDGYGRNGLWLAKQGFRVHTVDLSPIGVALARNSARDAGLSLTIEQADLSTWAWPRNQFDAIFSIFCALIPECALDHSRRHVARAGNWRTLHPRSLHSCAAEILLRRP
jgi:Cyclopropane fatty acid synthase and related methyltransferases